jgi:hypothetical protein
LFSYVTYEVFVPRRYLAAQRQITKAYPNPTDQERDAIAVAKILLDTVRSTKFYMAWDEDVNDSVGAGFFGYLPSKLDRNAIYDARFALRHFRASHPNFPSYVLKAAGEKNKRALVEAELHIIEAEVLMKSFELLVPPHLLDQMERMRSARIVALRFAMPAARRHVRFATLVQATGASETLQKQLLKDFTTIERNTIQYGDALRRKQKGTRGIVALTGTLQRASVFCMKSKKGTETAIERAKNLPNSMPKNELLDALEARRRHYARLASNHARVDDTDL